MDNTSINLVHEDVAVNLCGTYGVENTQRGEHIMVLELGAPVSLAGRSWLSKYLLEFEYKIEDMVSSDCYQVLRFGGIDKKHESKIMIELPLVVTSTDGKDAVLKAYVYVIDEDVTFLVGKKTLENCDGWCAKES